MGLRWVGRLAQPGVRATLGRRAGWKVSRTAADRSARTAATRFPRLTYPVPTSGWRGSLNRQVPPR